MKCAQPACPETVRDSKWDMIRAQAGGWFFTRDGAQSWCPAHTPEWVTAWRAAREGEDHG
jgi:hypothetical protein